MIRWLSLDLDGKEDVAGRGRGWAPRHFPLTPI